MSILFIKVTPLSLKHFLLKTLICFKWHSQYCWMPQRCSGTHTLGLSLFCLSASDITRHQVCTGGLWEAVQTNHRPGFLSKENKPSRWDTFIIFWEGSLIQGLGTDMHVAQARSCRLVNSIKCGGYVFGRIVLRQTGLSVCNSGIVSVRFKMSACTKDPQCLIKYNIESLTKSLIVPLSHSFIFSCPTFSRQGLSFRLTQPLRVYFLVAPHCGVSATSQAYSLWKLFSLEQAHFFLVSTRPMASLCPNGRALLIILWAQHRVNTLTFYIHITDPRVQLIFVLVHIKHSCSYLFMLNP